MAKLRAGVPSSLDAARNVIGPQVRKLRRQQHLSQPKLVVRCQLAGYDLSRESLAKIEGGWRVVSDVEILLLANVLGVPFPVLFPEPGRLADIVQSFKQP